MRLKTKSISLSFGTDFFLGLFCSKKTEDFVERCYRGDLRWRFRMIKKPADSSEVHQKIHQIK